MKSATLAIVSTFVILVILVLPLIVTPSFATTSYHVNFQSHAAGPTFIAMNLSDPIGVVGSGTFTLSGTAKASDLEVTPFPLPGGPPVGGSAAIVAHPEDAKIGGSMVVKWTNATGDYRLVLRLSAGEMPSESPVVVDYWGAFFYEDNYIFCVVHYTGVLVSGRISTQVSGDGMLFALSQVTTPTIPATVIEVWLFGPNGLWLIPIWSSVAIPIPISPGLVPAAVAARTNVNLV